MKKKIYTFKIKGNSDFELPTGYIGTDQAMKVLNYPNLDAILEVYIMDQKGSMTLKISHTVKTGARIHFNKGNHIYIAHKVISN